MTVRRLIMQEWLYILGIILGAIGIVAGGWAYHLEQLDDLDEQEQVQALLKIVSQNRDALQALTEAQRLGPRHTACDTKQILDDLRASGIPLPIYQVEARCR